MVVGGWHRPGVLKRHYRPFIVNTILFKSSEIASSFLLLSGSGFVAFGACLARCHAVHIEMISLVKVWLLYTIISCDVGLVTLQVVVFCCHSQQCTKFTFAAISEKNQTSIHISGMLLLCFICVRDSIGTMLFHFWVGFVCWHRKGMSFPSGL